jgi:hypothetical protein
MPLVPPGATTYSLLDRFARLFDPFVPRPGWIETIRQYP